jgi:restriction system protein
VEHPPFRAWALGTQCRRRRRRYTRRSRCTPSRHRLRACRRLFGGKRKHAEATTAARTAFEAEHAAWRQACADLHASKTAELDRRNQLEHKRVQSLAEAEAKYQQECRQREAEAEERNEQLTQFINDLAFDVESAIQEYVGVVLSNSVYPDAFPVSYDHRFDLQTRELTLTVTVPEPSAVPAVKEYRYVKAKDEIVSTALTAKDQKQRYAGAVWQVAIRTLHEIFEADRAGKIRSIALTVATGHCHLPPACPRRSRW